MQYSQGRWLLVIGGSTLGDGNHAVEDKYWECEDSARGRILFFVSCKLSSQSKFNGAHCVES